MQCLGLYEMMMRKRQQQIKSFANYHNSLLGNIKLKDEAPNTIEDTQHDVPPELTQYERDLLACKRLPELKIHASRTMLAEMIFEEYIKVRPFEPFLPIIISYINGLSYFHAFPPPNRFLLLPFFRYFYFLVDLSFPHIFFSPFPDLSLQLSSSWSRTTPSILFASPLK